MGAWQHGLETTGSRTMNAMLSPARQSANQEIAAHSLGEIRSFLEELKHGTRKYRTIASLSGQIAEAYRGRCVLELLQNAHDALADGQGGDPGLITFVLETAPEPVLLIANSGRAFEHKDFKGLCRLGQSPKDPNRSVGNKGLGFHSVLEVATAPEIWSIGATDGSPAFVFRFDPVVRERIAEALAKLAANGLGTRSPFDASERLVDWTDDQLRRYLDRLRDEGLDGADEAMAYLSPYDVPLLIEGGRGVVDELLGKGHVTVVRLPLDGGRAGEARDALLSVRAQLEGLVDVSTALFLPRLRTLVVTIDGETTVVRRTVHSDEAFGKGDRSRRQRVRIARSDASGETEPAGRFLVWTRMIGGDEDRKGATRIHNAVQHLPNKWPEVNSVQVGVAVREGEESPDGRFVIFLPTEMATGTGAHINAPFFGSLDRRRIQFDDEYNRLLLDCVLDLSLDVIAYLASRESVATSGCAIVDILSTAADIGDTGEDMLSLLRERAASRGTPLDGWSLVLCDEGWAVPTVGRMMPEVVDGLAIDAETLRGAAKFSVVSRSLDGRGFEVKALLERLDGSPAPLAAEWVRTVEEMAVRVRSGEIDATWDGYLTALIEVLPRCLVRAARAGVEDALASAKFLPDQDGRLVSADGPARVFFQPVIGMDDAAELVETVPHSLKHRIAFIHGDVRTHEEGSRRRSTEVHKFLEGRFARGFRRDEILRDVVLAMVPPTPASFGSAEAALCAELLGWTLGLLGEEPPQALVALLKDLPVACGDGWRPAREASFGSGWPGRSGKDLQMLCEELGGDAGERLARTALLNPEDPRWGVDVGGRANLFADIGVAQGLRLRPVAKMPFQMAQWDYELPGTAPSGVDGAAWEEWRTAVRPEAALLFLCLSRQESLEFSRPPGDGITRHATG